MLAVFKFYLSANTKMDQAPENYDLDVDPNLPYLKSQNNGYHSREFQRKNGMTAEQEAEVFLKLRNINIMCSMNDTKKKFKKLWEEKGFHGLRLSTDYKLVEDNGQYMVYSYKKGMLFYVTKDDYNVISALKDGKINMHRLEKLLGSSAHMWCEKYFFFEILEYEKTAISAIVA